MKIKEQAKKKAMRLGRKALNAYGDMLVRHSLHGNQVFYNPEDFPWISRVESCWQAVRRELDEVLKDREHIPAFNEVSKDQAHLTNDGRWKTFFFYAYGHKAQANCDRCPETARLLEGIPGMKTAFFSILEGPNRIPEHRGPFNGVLRYHLALKVPQPNEACGIRVGGQVAHWQEGSSLVFDDTYPHAAWNETDGERVVLFVDFARPLEQPYAFVNDMLIRAIGRSPFVQEGIRNYEKYMERATAASKASERSSRGAGASL